VNAGPGPAPFDLLPGASWLTPEGEVIPIAGFHEEWLREHEEVAQGARNACELVLARRWLSVALFDEGYLEIMAPNRSSDDVRRAMFALLSRNAGKWSRALVMSMDEEGYSMLGPADAADEAALAAALERTI
jgi:hypothetical protein